ncbi:MAG: HlyD family efflux transporter periplasmic adaptor subunit [Bacteroidetes bacterium]|nr:HlyD family efflux transporter periplasmic adaptor subunit [Bacteroidota bacterium]MBU1372857.1 HlyD family efflux transporter periplasmic adaptor subunit [Bacteroidota bacterium]MBU1485586.1 HlyD family efflux transporter periplasmic adaptor subunit [Bacteroidota bacterium]MBU1759314.1 HlyD family efflux transporter periplasmic adaptor subunit [Bacteroidota bacterium]MBU2046741.1 HlyD family efflux transporter periplasmic adaptor subunit [Bacteroidota bacterium]
MDRQIQQKKWNRKRILTVAGITALVLLIGGSYYFTSGKSRLNVDTERTTISEIKKGSFQEFIPVNGVVLPVTTIYLDAMEGGRVEEKFVEDGAMMKKGQPILRLSNTDLELQLANQETQVFNVLTQMQISKNNAEQNSINRQNQDAEVDNALKEAERVYNLNKKLYADRVIGSQEFNSSKNLYEYQVRRKKLTEDIMKTDATSMKQQVSQMGESYEQMKKTLALMRKKVGDLVVRAPVDGQLTSLDAEIGESKNKGQRLGQLDVMSGFKVRVDVDEHYISRIFTGLKGDADIAGKNYPLEIKKVYTQVTNGRFQVDMEFVGAAPKNIRRGQTVQIHLTLSDETQAVLLPKGGFYQQTGGNWIFKVGENGNVAYKVDIQLGRQNPDYYEVLQGLKPGDKVITNSYENYGDMQELILKK